MMVGFNLLQPLHYTTLPQRNYSNFVYCLFEQQNPFVTLTPFRFKILGELPRVNVCLGISQNPSEIAICELKCQVRATALNS